jgi:hypothetical protein
MNDRIVDVLQGHTLADLLDPEWIREHDDGGALDGDGGELPDGFGCNPTRGDGRPEDPC